MLHYVVRNSLGQFFKVSEGRFFLALGDGDIFRYEDTAIRVAAIARSTFPELGVKVSAFRVELSDV